MRAKEPLLPANRPLKGVRRSGLYRQVTIDARIFGPRARRSEIVLRRQIYCDRPISAKLDLPRAVSGFRDQRPRVGLEPAERRRKGTSAPASVGHGPQEEKATAIMVSMICKMVDRFIWFEQWRKCYV